MLVCCVHMIHTRCMGKVCTHRLLGVHDLYLHFSVENILWCSHSRLEGYLYLGLWGLVVEVVLVDFALDLG